MSDHGEIVIKKYANRRLYDTESSAYITYDGLEKLLAKGYQLKVIDAKTGDDLTKTTLSHLLSEQVATDRHALSPELLQFLIQLSMKAPSAQFTPYLHFCLSLFEKQFLQYAQRPSAIDIEKIARDLETILKKTEKSGSPVDKTRKVETPLTNEPERSAQPGIFEKAMLELKKEIAALENRVKKLETEEK